MIAILIVGILAIIFVLPCLIIAGRASRNEEVCEQCIYAKFVGHNSPCFICAAGDRFERKVDNE